MAPPSSRDPSAATSFARARAALEHIERGLTSAERHALANLTRDLEAVALRVRSGEYARTDFLNRNVFDVPRRTREFFLYMAGYQRHASDWVKALDGIDLAEAGEVLDVCPGWAPKIELALLQTAFRGAVTVADRDADALDALTTFITGFQPAFSVLPLCVDVTARPARTWPLVCANHIIDDLMLSMYAPHLEDIYEDESAFAAAWRAVLAQRDVVLERMPATLGAALGRWVTPGGVLVLSHYDSFVDGLLGAVGAQFVTETFRATVAALKELGFSPERELPAGYIRLRAPRTPSLLS